MAFLCNNKYFRHYGCFAGDDLRLQAIQPLPGGQSGTPVFLLSYVQKRTAKQVVARVLTWTDSAQREFVF